MPTTTIIMLGKNTISIPYRCLCLDHVKKMYQIGTVANITLYNTTVLKRYNVSIEIYYFLCHMFSIIKEFAASDNVHQFRNFARCVSILRGRRFGCIISLYRYVYLYQLIWQLSYFWSAVSLFLPLSWNESCS